MAERPLLILLHGWGSTDRVWQPIAPYLEAQFDCRFFNLPGHGETVLTQTRIKPLASQILDQINRPAVWLGWSLGALLTMQAALMAPELAERLLLVSGTPAFVQRAGWDDAMPAATFRQFELDYSNNPGRTLRRFMTLQSHGDSQSKTIIQQLRVAATDELSDIGWGLQVLHDNDLRHEMSAINCAVHCLYGEKDALVPPSVAHAMQQQKNVKAMSWSDTGHAPFLSRPQDFVRWMQGAVHG
jgi:pimeloyl-[acyl-carrier protein] methyl ester esterase